MTDEQDGHRDRGIELGSLPEKLEQVSFPVEKSSLLEEFGQHELEFEDGDRSNLRSVLQPAGLDEFESREELIETIYLMVGSSAVGQVGQTGRGTSDITPPDEQRPPEKPDDEEEQDQSL